MCVWGTVQGVCAPDPVFTSCVAHAQGHKKISHSIFSLCFTLDGGSFTLGGYDERQHRGAISYVPVSKSDGFYNVRLRDVRVGNTSLGFKEEEVRGPLLSRYFGMPGLLSHSDVATSLPLPCHGIGVGVRCSC